MASIELSEVVSSLASTSLSTSELADKMLRTAVSVGGFAFDGTMINEYGDHSYNGALDAMAAIGCPVPDLPTMPEMPLLAAVAAVDVPAAPVFSGNAPAVDFDIAKPDAFTRAPPLAPDIQSVIVPDDPALVIPEMPSLSALNLPSVPVINLPVFDAVLPDAPGDMAVTFAWDEEGYSSELMTALQAAAAELIDGVASGYDVSVETAVWDKDRGALDRKLVDDAEKMRRSFCARGFRLPPGYLAQKLAEMQLASKDASGGASMKVAGEQADREQANRQLAFQVMQLLEQALIAYSGQMARRGLEAAKFAQQALLDVFDAVLKRYEAQVQALSVRAKVFRDQLAAEIAQLDLYRAELEAQKILGTINLQQLEIYKARLGGAMAAAMIYVGQVQAARARIENSNVLVLRYAEQVRAFGAQVEAKAAEYRGYAAEVKAEVSKVELTKAEAKAYSSEAEAYDAGVKATSEQTKLEYKSKHQLPLKAFRAQLAGYRAKVEAVSAQLQGYAGSIGAAARVFDASIGANAALANASIDIQKGASMAAIAQAGIGLEVGKGEWKESIANARKAVSIAASAAHLQAGMAASAMSAVNVSAGYSDTASYSEAESSENNTSSTGRLTNQSMKEDRYISRA